MIYNCANWADLPWTEVRPGVRRKAFTGEGATFAMNELQPHHEPRPTSIPMSRSLTLLPACATTTSRTRCSV